MFITSVDLRPSLIALDLLSGFRSAIAKIRTIRYMDYGVKA